MSKELSEMTLQELWELFPISLVAPRDGWKDDYREIEAVLKTLLSDRFAPRISHIGSTAIGGIWAKNIVDVLVKICTALGCTMDDIVEIVPDNKRVVED